MSGVAVRRRLAAGWPAVVALLSALLVLGPALRPGLVQTYDLGWSPDARWTPAILGLDAPAPRVVPSDAVVTAAGSLLAPGVVQKLILVGMLVAASLGARSLLVVGARAVGRRTPAAGAVLLVVLLAQWNPFVAQRLVIGQWTVLLGYCLIPWVWLALLRGGRRCASTTAALLVLASLGGANTWLMVLSALVPAAVVVHLRRRRAVDGQGGRRGSGAGSLLLVGGAAIGGAVCWALPALLAGSSGEGSGGISGVEAFAARTDSRFGFVGSLLSGGGIWNPYAHGAERGDPVASTALLLVAVVALVTLAHRARRGDPLGAVLLAGALPALAVALFSAWEPARGIWTALVDSAPGGGLLRDSQKLVAPWVVAATVGAGAALHSLVHRRPTWGLSVAAAALLPVPLAATMIWGFHGRLEAVQVPDQVRAAAAQLSTAEPGMVGLLPWNQYRRYPWNGDRTSLSIVPRMVDQRVLSSDALPLSTGTVAGESPQAARVDRRIAAGQDPVAALRAQGVRYLWWEQTAGAQRPAVPDDARVLVDTPSTLVLGFPEAEPVPAVPHLAARIVGGLISLATAVVVLVLWLHFRSGRVRGAIDSARRRRATQDRA